MFTSLPCYHCGLQAVSSINASVAGETQYFCCVGCKTVALTIAEQGLADFYRYRDVQSVKADEAAVDFSAFDLEDVQSDFVRDIESGFKAARLFIDGIRCAACVWLIEKHLATITGIGRVSVNASSQSASIEFNPQVLPLSQVFAALHAIGYTPQPLLAQSQQAQWKKVQRDDVLRLGVAGIGMMQAGMVAVALHAGGMQGIEPQWQQLLRLVSLLITIPIMAYSARPFFSSALRALRLKHLNMDVPVSLALLLAFSASAWATIFGGGDVYFDSVSMFTFFLLLGRFLEKRARFNNFNARIKRAQVLPLTAQLCVDAKSQVERKTVPVKSLAEGNYVWVSPGAVIPCDGEVVDGTSEVDEAIITGEAQAIKKTCGDKVIAGAFNGSTALIVKVTATGANTELAAIERLVEEAELTRPKQVALADRIAARFVAAVLMVSVVVGGIWLWVDAAKALWVVLSVLVVTCPCALSLATPAVLTAGINCLRNKGILVTGINAIEAVQEANHIVFDKTGTLTQGKLSVAQVRMIPSGHIPGTELNVAENTSTRSVLNLAAALEAGSSHPIAKAFQWNNSDGRLMPMVADRKTELGAGVSGMVDGVRYRLGTAVFACSHTSLPYPGEGLWLLLSRNSIRLNGTEEPAQPIAWLHLEDSTREEAGSAIKKLKQQGLQISLLSGDRQENVNGLARNIHIQNALGGLLPAQKLGHVKEWQAKGQSVVMVGDGINDVPVLTAANVSVAMGSATEFAQNKADCVLLKNDLSALPDLFRISHKVKRIIKQNLSWAIVYNLTALPLAAAGLVPPWMAAIGMSLSSLVVVLNALRIR